MSAGRPGSRRPRPAPQASRRGLAGSAAALAATLAALGGLLASGSVQASSPHATSVYPLDGYERTSIRRLYAYRLAQRGELPGPQLVPGATLSVDDSALRMTPEGRELDLTASTPRDPELQRGLEAIFSRRSREYSVAVLDVTEPEAPRYAELRADRTYLPGSVGKVLVMTGVFDALARLWPEPDDRLRVLRTTPVVAGRVAMPNSHTVPIAEVHPPALVHRSIRLGDTFSLFEWIDHMVSPSSNAAGAVVWKELMLLRRFGRDYPPPPEAERLFFRDLPRRELTELALAVVEEPLIEAGLDTGRLRIGTLFTAGGKALVPGTRSYASPRELVRWLLRLEQGRLVDEWSSLEMKRLLYFTRNRYRYAASGALRDAAVYFKSGSFYRCEPEPGFECGKYRGNVATS